MDAVPAAQQPRRRRLVRGWHAAGIERVVELPMKTLHCARCAVPLNASEASDIPLHHCTECSGVWMQSETFERICDDRDQQAAILLRERFGATSEPSVNPARLP